ncbi:LLM class flavin-dependent oxidoreductase [bacterium]|jgi:alkanesulfonate monooxygenase SsuD/methylene tetrahydromethanopterin reductase-like flavin-dependent oxidoreductase (luciferase family)|nr:LLM class flavin-dependent oxidoreductase [bacterium]
MAHQRDLKFGWLSPVIGNRWSDHQPIVMYQERNILPTALQHFDSLWIADHFYGFDEKTDPFMEAWTTLTWLAAKFPNVLLCHHVLGQGYRNPALTAKMAATLQMLSGNRFILGIGAGWRDDEYKAYGYEFPRPAVRFAELEEVIHICRLMWTQDAPTFTGKHFQITEAAAPPKPEVIPPVCIGAYGEQIGLPMVGRLADMWNASTQGSVERWLVKRDIVRASAEKSGRNSSDIQISITVEKPLPNTDEESEILRTELQTMVDHGVEHFVMDFGHPQSTEPVMRFVEQVMQPMKAAR